MFQPGEEMHDGAALMIAEGVLDAAGRRADAAYAIHAFAATVPGGHVVSRRGAMLAAADGFEVVVEGRGGHGSAPQHALDPVPVACEIVMALQTMTTRRFDVFDPVVVTVGSLRAGDAPNVIPEDARLVASVRSWSTEARARFRELAGQLARGIAQAHGMTAHVSYLDGYPVTHTSADETDFAGTVVADVLGEDTFSLLPQPFSASEDFSRALQSVPGTFLGLGATPAGLNPASAPFNHSAHAAYDDDVLPLGAAIHTELAIRRLATLPS